MSVENMTSELKLYKNIKPNLALSLRTRPVSPGKASDEASSTNHCPLYLEISDSTPSLSAFERTQLKGFD